MPKCAGLQDDGALAGRDATDDEQLFSAFQGYECTGGHQAERDDDVTAAA